MATNLMSITGRALAEAARSYFIPVLMVLGVGRKDSRLPSTRRRIDALIDHDMTVAGNLSCDAARGIRLEGPWFGDITCEQGFVIVGRSATVKGNIRVHDAEILGTVDGSVFAKGQVEIHHCAVIEGNVEAKYIEMHLGATVRGQITADKSSAETNGDSGDQARPPGIRVVK